MMVLLWYGMVVVMVALVAAGVNKLKVTDEGKRSVLRCPARPRTAGIMTNDDCISWG